jgi:hypothetical protein
LSLMERCYHGPFGKAPRHLPYRRAAMSFMRWQLRRGVLHQEEKDHARERAVPFPIHLIHGNQPLLGDASTRGAPEPSIWRVRLVEWQ